MKATRTFLTFLSFVGIISLPGLLNYFGFQPFIFSTLQKIQNEFWDNFEIYIKAIMQTLAIGVVSIGLSITIGLFFGILFAYFDKYIGFFETTIKFIWSLPLICVAVFLHLFIDSSYIFAIVTGTFLGVFPILSFVYRKSLEYDDGVTSLIASFNLSKRSEFLYLQIPRVIENLKLPLLQAVPLTFIGVTMGEWQIGGAVGATYNGLGVIFKTAFEHSKFEQVYIAMFLMMAIVFFSGEVVELFPRFYTWLKTKVHNYIG